MRRSAKECSAVKSCAENEIRNIARCAEKFGEKHVCRSVLRNESMDGEMCRQREARALSKGVDREMCRQKEERARVPPNR
jgi:hypothetical protein